MQIDVNKFRADLENQLLTRIGILPNYGVPTGVQSSDGSIMNTSPEKNYKQSSIAQLSDKEVILLKLFGEFTKKDEGKELSAELGKFSRFVQSEVMKASKAT